MDPRAIGRYAAAVEALSRSLPFSCLLVALFPVSPRDQLLSFTLTVIITHTTLVCLELCYCFIYFSIGMLLTLLSRVVYNDANREKSTSTIITTTYRPIMRPPYPQALLRNGEG